MAHLKTATGTFRVEIEGREGAPVLMLSNSLGTDLHMWDPQMAALTQKFRVLRYDSRGHGGSDGGFELGSTPYSIALLAQDALAILDALDLPRVHWLGLSLGGMVGQWLLAHAPERIERAVLANTSSYMPDARPWNSRILQVQSQGMASVTDAVIDRWFTPEFQERDPTAVERIATMLRTTSAQGYVATCAAVRDMDQRETIRSANCPVLVIAGTRDPATPPSLCKNIVEAIPDAQYVEFDTAHLSNIEEPEAFSKAVLNFLTERTKKILRKPAARKTAKKAVKTKATKAKATKAKVTKAKVTKVKPAKAKPAKAKTTKAKPTKAKTTKTKSTKTKPTKTTKANKTTRTSSAKKAVKKTAKKAAKKTVKKAVVKKTTKAQKRAPARKTVARKTVKKVAKKIKRSTR